jgi:hypothetical protein
MYSRGVRAIDQFTGLTFAQTIEYTGLVRCGRGLGRSQPHLTPVVYLVCSSVASVKNGAAVATMVGLRGRPQRVQEDAAVSGPTHHLSLSDGNLSARRHLICPTDWTNCDNVQDQRILFRD